MPVYFIYIYIYWWGVPICAHAHIIDKRMHVRISFLEFPFLQAALAVFRSDIYPGILVARHARKPL